MVEYFENNIGERIPLHEWVSLLKYLKGTATTNMPVELYMLTRLMQSEKRVTPHKRYSINLGIPLEKEDSYPEALLYWLQVWFQNYTSWSDKMVEEVDHLNAAIFKICSRMVTLYTLER